MLVLKDVFYIVTALLPLTLQNLDLDFVRDQDDKFKVLCNFSISAVRVKLIRVNNSAHCTSRTAQLSLHSTHYTHYIHYTQHILEALHTTQIVVILVVISCQIKTTNL